MSNFEFLKKDDKKIIILSHIKPDSDLPRMLGITHPEKPMKDSSSMRSYLGHLLQINGDEVLNELITGFNKTVSEKTVQELSVKIIFRIKEKKFWICDDGLVLCTGTGPTGSYIGAKLQGKLTRCVPTYCDLYGYFGIGSTSRPEYWKFIREWNKYGGDSNATRRSI